MFLLRQYMLTIPRELIEAARMDNACEWQIYWRIVLPLSAPALAVLAIFSVMWRWNDFLWPLVVLTEDRGLHAAARPQRLPGRAQTQWHYLLAMTVMTLLPVALVFVFLQRFITTGIAEYRHEISDRRNHGRTEAHATSRSPSAPSTIIHGVDLEVADGEFVVFVGPSGCGKSTLLRMIAGLEQATGGDISIDGSSVTDVPAPTAGSPWCSSPMRSTRI